MRVKDRDKIRMDIKPDNEYGESIPYGALMNLGQKRLNSYKSNFPEMLTLEKTSRCVICRQTLQYVFGRPRKLCGNKSCYLEWKRRRYQTLQLVAKTRRLSSADFEFAEPICICGNDRFAWTYEGVFCLKCGVREPLFSLEPWLPTEFAPKPACTCTQICKQSSAYKLWAYV